MMSSATGNGAGVAVDVCDSCRYFFEISNNKIISINVTDCLIVFFFHGRLSASLAQDIIKAKFMSFSTHTAVVILATGLFRKAICHPIYCRINAYISIQKRLLSALWWHHNFHTEFLLSDQWHNGFWLHNNPWKFTIWTLVKLTGSKRNIQLR